MPSNIRRANGTRRNKAVARIKATQDHCALCGRLVDKSLVAGHPMAAEIDEIIPVSKGGSPYNIENLQLAHRICNQRRGNKSMQEIRHTKAEVKNLPMPTSRDW